MMRAATATLSLSADAIKRVMLYPSALMQYSLGSTLALDDAKRLFGAIRGDIPDAGTMAAIELKKL